MRRIVLLLLFAACLVSCRTVKEIQTVTDTVAVHDTTFLAVHDTTTIVDVKYDSVDRYVEKITYVDTNGVVHEREVERLVKVIETQSEESRKTISVLRSQISVLEKRLEESQGVQYVEKRLKWWQEGLMWAGGVSLVALFLTIFFRLYKIKNGKLR